MAINKGILVVLCTVLVTVIGQVSEEGTHGNHAGHHGSHEVPHGHHGGPHENQERVRRQAVEIDDEDENPDLRRPKWTACDIKTTPLISCHDCTTRLICKPVGGLLKYCDNPVKPYCNRGICSAVRSDECA